MNTQNEIWENVLGYEGMYQVSNLGNVRSLKCGKVKLLKATLTSVGYPHVGFINRKLKKYFTVHKLVTTAFLGSSNGLDTNHKDGNRLNNALSNLEYISRRDNVVHGRLSMQKKGKSSKYTGVSWNKNNCKFQALIRINGKQTNLGVFECELEASQAYQRALLEVEEGTIYASKS